MMTRPTKRFVAAIATVGCALAATAVGRADVSGGGFGMAGRGQVPQAAVALGTIASDVTVKSASYGSGGVGLRNRGGGSIGISGVTTPVKVAYLYWGVITNGAPTSADTSVSLQRLVPTTSSAVVVTGAAIGTGASPCWGGDRITIFRGTVPTSVADGNGSYQLVLRKGAAGLTNGVDPWTTVTLPLVDGASLVIVGTGTATVSIFDKGLAGHTFASNPGLTYTLKLPIAAPGKTTHFNNIGADGQHGISSTDISLLSDEITRLDGTKIAGPGSPANDSDWNGSSGFPLPQLWDDTSHDVSTLVKAKATTLGFSIVSSASSEYDCLTPVANVLSLQ